MRRQLDDLQLDAELRHFLQARADDTARVRDAEAMSRAIAAGTARGAGRPALGRATWLVLVATLLAIAAIAAIGVGGLRRAADVTPQGGPSNGWIAYATQSHRIPTDIYVVREGVEPRLIAGTDAANPPGVCPAFSPDGTMLAYGLRKRVDGVPIGAIAVLTLADDGSALEPAIHLPIAEISFAPCPTWSPDSATLAFLAADTLVLTHLDGSSRRLEDWEVATDVGVATSLIDFPPDHELGWSPDGSTIAVAKPSGTWLVPIDGNPARRLDPEPAYSLSWSPDGSAIAIGAATQGRAAHVIHLSGDEQDFYLPPGGKPVWSPTGDRIAFDGRDVTVVRADGTDARVLADGRNPVWSPDGEMILVVRDVAYNAWILAAATVTGDGPEVAVVPSIEIRDARSWGGSENISWQPLYPEASRDLSDSPLVTPTSAPPFTPTPQTPTDAPATEPSALPRLAGAGPVMAWSQVTLDDELLDALVPQADVRSRPKVAWLGDRFVLAGEPAGAVATSLDGRAWTLLDATDPQRALYRRALASESWILPWDGAESTSRLAAALAAPPTGGALGAVGAGPVGVVAMTHSTLDFDAYITTLLGPGWVEHMTLFDYTDGVLRIETDDDRSTEIVWADQGFAPGDVADRGFGWYSADGEAWLASPAFPSNVYDIAGVADGFIVRGADDKGTGMWHSADGLTWRRLGVPSDGPLIPWRDGLLDSDAVRRFDHWTSEGQAAMPMATELPASWTGSAAALGAGPLGVVAIGTADRSVLVTRDGADWSLQPMPDAMVLAPAGGSSVTVAVGDGAVVVLGRSGTGEPGALSLWVGTLQP